MASTIAPRAYSYTRFSTPDQAKGDSLRRQTALADEYARRHNLTLDEELNLRDLGVSAFRGDNVATGALGAFLQAIRNGLVPKGSYLLVESLDRVSRKQARKAVRILEEIVEAGVTVVTLNDGKEYTEDSLDGTDFLIAIIVLMRAHEESATKAKRLRAAWVGKRQRAAGGEVQTTRVPAWIQCEGSGAKDARNAKLSLNPDRAELVRRIFSMFLEGKGKAGIAQHLNESKVTTWGAGEGRRPAAHWHKTYIFKILTSPTVTGRLVPHIEQHDSAGKFSREPQEAIPDYYPRVIDDKTFKRVQKLIQARRKDVRSSSVASIVAGLAKCPTCGSTMTRVMKGTEKRTGVPKLVCTKAKAGAGCAYVSVPVRDVESALIDGARILGNPPLVDENLAEEIENVSGALFHHHEEIENLVNTIEHRPSAALSKRLAAREAEAVAIKAELAELEARAEDSESRVVNHRAKRLSESLIRLKREPEQIAAANSALRECLNAIVVDHKAGKLRLQWRNGASSTLLFGTFGFPIVEESK
jgi:DNA invertase Pin-like site-specific DNA recombinase